MWILIVSSSRFRVKGTYTFINWDAYKMWILNSGMNKREFMKAYLYPYLLEARSNRLISRNQRPTRQWGQRRLPNAPKYLGIHRMWSYRSLRKFRISIPWHGPRKCDRSTWYIWLKGERQRVTMFHIRNSLLKFDSRRELQNAYT